MCTHSRYYSQWSRNDRQQVRENWYDSTLRVAYLWLHKFIPMRNKHKNDNTLPSRNHVISFGRWLNSKRRRSIWRSSPQRAIITDIGGCSMEDSYQVSSQNCHWIIISTVLYRHTRRLSNVGYISDFGRLPIADGRERVKTVANTIVPT